jgi:hypothetical protein
MNALNQRVHYRAERVKDLEDVAAANPAYKKRYWAAKKELKKVRDLAERTKKHLASKRR